MKLITNRLFFYTSSLILSFIIFAVTSHTLLKSAYVSYWNGLYRVQTVDFNILSALLPDVMTPLIKNNDKEKAKKIVESNFNLFSIVVMKCKDSDCTEKELFIKNKGRRVTNDWKNKVNGSVNIQIPIFSDPEEQVVIFEHSYVDSYKVLPYANEEIGFIYLFRRNFPSYEVDMEDFIMRWWKNQSPSARHTHYKTSILLAFLISAIFFLAIFSLRAILLSAYRNKMMVGKLLSAIDEKYGPIS